MRKICLIVTVLLIIYAQALFAVKVSSLYKIEMPVSSQTVETRSEAVKAGFLQVLIKVSGDPQIENNPTIRSDLSKAEYYVQEFSYSSPSTNSSQFFINIRYDEGDVNRLLRKAGVQSWGENRPLILVWLAITNNENTEIIGTETSMKISEEIKTQGKKYGLPLIFPMMDVTDINHIATEDVTEMVMPTLKAASKRYAPDAYLIGSIEQNENGYQSKWELFLDENQWDFSIQDINLESIFASIVNQVSQTLAKHYIVKQEDNSANSVKLEVTNITQRNDLARLMRYLKQLSSVQQVRLSQVSGNVVEITVLIQGPTEVFLKNAAVDQHLVLKSQDAHNNKLTYEWVH